MFQFKQSSARFVFSILTLIFMLISPVTQASNTPAKTAKSSQPKVLMETSLGPITLQLYPDKAPKTVANFLRYVKEGFYNGTVFHRVIPGFMIQGGGFTPDMARKSTHAPIVNEASNHLHNTLGTIAMARTNDPNSATSQFFINTVSNSFLDYSSSNYGYAVFGKVIDGMKTVKKIEFTPTTRKFGMADVPVNNVVIKSIKLLP
jgi:peptidyl-prolyl cis-trans isomerase B (cyclophilin B)